MREEFFLKLSDNIDAFSKRRQSGDELTTSYIPYGTAGFRGQADKIQHLFYKVGIVAGLRCLVKQANVGVMVTASHNPIQDNGVKLIEPDGQMLPADWEPIVERFCNLSFDDILENLKKLIEQFQIDPMDPHSKSYNVLVGYDTRPSSEFLVDLLSEGLKLWQNIEILNYNQVTTPALHYLVAKSNQKGRPIRLEEYYDQLIAGSAECFNNHLECNKKDYRPNELVLDCANGVGYKTLEYLCNNNKFNDCLPVKLINIGDGILNLECGADFVKTKLKPPKQADQSGIRYAALDGDADRLIYFYLKRNGDEHQELKLLDGDKIMALYAIYLKDVLERAKLIDQLTLGVIQTAYANGASTDFMQQQLKLKVDCVDTGVKNLHHKALDYDVGIYFEANGHGTIWISDKARKSIDDAIDDAGLELKRLLKILNNFTGDAISDILIVESILNHYDMNIEKWYEIYQDWPNCILNVQVNDRNMVKTTNAGTTCSAPLGLQADIDSIVGQFWPRARCFVRASGTEDVVRVYAEADTRAKAEELAKLVGERVMKICNA